MIVKFNDCAISSVDFRKNSTCSQIYVQSNGSLHDCRGPLSSVCLSFAEQNGEGVLTCVSTIQKLIFEFFLCFRGRMFRVNCCLQV